MKVPVKLHFWLTAAAALLLLPVCFATRLKLVLTHDLFAFVVGWLVQSLVWAGLLYQFGVPGSWEALKKNWQRLIIAAILPLVLIPVLGSNSEVWLIWFCGLVFVEFYYRGGNWASAASALGPWIYLTIGLQIAFAFNTAIVSVRRFNLYDPFFLQLDRTLFHASVADISHASSSLYAPAEVIYYAMGGVMGAAILFLCLSGDRDSAFQMAGAIITAYLLSLIVFWAWPSNGPYSLDPVSLPASTVTAAIQHASFVNATALYQHRVWLAPVYGYFVAFPSMHVAQPLVAGWFLRRWRRVSILIYVYCGLLTAAIIILKWHYFVDIIGGVLISIVAVGLSSVSVGGSAKVLPMRRSGSGLTEEG